MFFHYEVKCPDCGKMFYKHINSRRKYCDDCSGNAAQCKRYAKSRRTKRAVDGAMVSPIERDWSGEEEDKAWAHLQKPPRN